MDTATPRRRRNVRIQYDFQPSERHLSLFRRLNPVFCFKYLTTSWTIVFDDIIDTVWKKDSWKRTLRRLYDAGFLDRPHQQRQSPNEKYKDLVYERTDKAAKLVDTDRKYTVAHRSNSYPHEILVDLGFYAPMHYAVMKDAELRVHTAQELMGGAYFTVDTPHGRRTLGFPETTQNSDDPFLVRLKSGREFRFDGTPFALEHLDTGNLLFIPGIEADRSTEGLKNIRPKDPTRTSLTKHIDDIVSFFLERQSLKQFGFNMMMVPIITTNEVHMRNAMAYVEKEIGRCAYILFKTVPDIALLEHFPKPSADFFATPWLRVGHSPFDLSTLSEVK